MRTNLFYKSRSFYHDFIHAGLQNPALTPKTRRSVLRFNQFSLLNIFSGLFFFFIHLFLGSWVLSFLDLLSVSIFFSAYRLNLTHRVYSPLFLSFVAMNAWVALSCMYDGLKSGCQFILLPQVISFIFLNSFRKWNWTLQIFPFLLGLQLILSIFAPASATLIQPTTLFTPILPKIHLIGSILLSILFILIMVRMHWQYEQFLFEEKKLSDLVFHTSSDGVFILKAATLTIKNCNQRAEELMETGKEQELLTGLKFEKLVEDSYRDSVPWNQLRVEKKSWQGELAFLTRQGNIFPAYASLIPFEYKKNDFIKVSILDLSHLKNTEFELIRAKEDAVMATNAKSRFLSHMSHEIRTPLSGVIESVRLILEEKNPEEKQAHLRSLKVLSDHLLQQVNDVLDFNKMDAGKLELDLRPLLLPDFADQLQLRFAPQIKRKGLEFVKTIDPQLSGCYCLADEVRMNQVLGNLISNAIKFTPEGIIYLKITLIGNSIDEADLLFEVIDSGIGIAKDKLEQVFEAFVQEDAHTVSNYGGSGLGLSIAKNLVASMGGTLNLDSEPGKGSRFYFNLKLKIAAQEQTVLTENRTILPDHLKVLIVDDHPVNRSVAGRLVQKTGANVVLAESGSQALTMMETQPFDIVMTDLEMPGMDGRTLMSQIKSKNKNNIVIAFSAAVNDTSKNELLKQGFDDVLCKPFRLKDLQDCLERNLSIT